MFNPLTPAEVVAAIGSTARGIARSDETLSAYARGQLLSAYSCSRHVSVEIERYGAEIGEFAKNVSRRTREAAPELSRGDDVALICAELERTTDARAAGDLISALMEHLRSDAAPAATELRARIQSGLRALAVREVELLAEVIEGAGSA